MWRNNLPESRNFESTLSSNAACWNVCVKFNNAECIESVRVSLGFGLGLWLGIGLGFGLRVCIGLPYCRTSHTRNYSVVSCTVDIAFYIWQMHLVIILYSNQAISWYQNVLLLISGFDVQIKKTYMTSISHFFPHSLHTKAPCRLQGSTLYRCLVECAVCPGKIVYIFITPTNNVRFYPNSTPTVKHLIADNSPNFSKVCQRLQKLLQV